MGYIPSLADFISLSRIPLAFAFVYYFPDPVMAPLILIVSWLTDVADGYMARMNGSSEYGEKLDALTDKFFVLTAVGYLLYAGAMSLFQVGIFLIREVVVAVLLVSVLLLSKKRRINYLKRKWEAKLTGKVVTGLQFITLLSVAAGSGNSGPLFIYLVFASVLAAFDYVSVVVAALKKR